MPTESQSDDFSPVKRTEISESELACAKREYRLLRRLVILALWVGCAVALSLNFTDPDLWGHVTYGQEVIRDGHLHRTATHTFTAEGYPWVNHENIAELTYATIYTWFDDEGLQIFKCLVGLAILGAMAWAAHRQGVRPLTMAAFLLLLANNLTAFFPVRPQVLSFAWCTTLLLTLELAFTGWRAWLVDEPASDESSITPWTPRRLGWLALLPVIMVLWTNSHGAFVAGICITGAYLAGRIVEAIYYQRTKSLGIVAAMVVAGLLVLAATFVNPYGTGLHEWLLLSLGSPRPEITEWAAPKPSDPVFWPLMTLIAVAIASIAFTRQRRDWVQIAILLLVGWQACSHLRHIAFFTLLCGFWVPVHLQSMLLRAKPDTSKLPVTRLGTWSRWGIATALLVAIGLQANTLGNRLERLPVYRHKYPVDAFQWMTFKDLHGRLVVPFNWAQYAIAALSPETTVSFDGRFRTCYPQEVVDKNFDFLLGDNKGYRYRRPEAGPIDPTAVLELGNPDLVLIDRQYNQPIEVMRLESEKPNPAWTLIYQDGLAQLWGRSSIYNDPQSDQYVAPEERLITDTLHVTAFDWPALPVQPTAKVLADRESSQTPNENLQ
ncbi:hypothetical protein [Aeoliella mucimassa]|uniref:Glycosyltransferase RgtA/B/C/D-like domain-containing protein n=1 Tax=Aeoliella mucimassa TaxID=2527972 RepID=A0A518AVD5_9BACT|nr:hypothetical protein [Aeoliella mucimassa]QDU58672.1 hypothetical protein Pan181_49120 [Aeoliella mucimassa]